MFFIRSGCMLLLFFSSRIVIQAQMDVILRKPSSSRPVGDGELPLDIDDKSRASSVFPDSQEFFESHDDIRDAIRFAQKFDSVINKHLIYPDPMELSLSNGLPNEQGMIKILKAEPNFITYDNDADEQNPLRDLLKFIDDAFQYATGPPKETIGSKQLESSQTFFPRGPNEEDNEPIGVLTIISLDDDDATPVQNNIYTPAGSMVINGSADAELGSFFVQGFLKSFMDSMQYMTDLLHNTSTSLNVGISINQSRPDQKVGIKIEDHGKTYDIPPYAYIVRSDPDMVNITWVSLMKDLNNSLCMKFSKDRDGVTILHHIRLRMLHENGFQDYNREDPVRLEGNKNNKMEIYLADGVGLEFAHPDPLDVVVEKPGKYSFQWMAMSIALLGLAVAGLIMLLSYILHTRNRYHARKDSMFKEPIA